MERPSVAGDHAHVRNLDTKHVGDHLRERRHVPLSLRTDTGRHPDEPARLNGHARALVRPDTRALDVVHDADANATTFGPELRLLFLDELLVADQVGRLLERGQVIAAVVGE
jgi:hypothetical protein